MALFCHGRASPAVSLLLAIVLALGATLPAMAQSGGDARAADGGGAGGGSATTPFGPTSLEEFVTFLDSRMEQAVAAAKAASPSEAALLEASWAHVTDAQKRELWLRFQVCGHDVACQDKAITSVFVSAMTGSAQTLSLLDARMEALFAKINASSPVMAANMKLAWAGLGTEQRKVALDLMAQCIGGNPGCLAYALLAVSGVFSQQATVNATVIDGANSSTADGTGSAGTTSFPSTFEEFVPLLDSQVLQALAAMREVSPAVSAFAQASWAQVSDAQKRMAWERVHACGDDAECKGQAVLSFFARTLIDSANHLGPGLLDEMVVGYLAQLNISNSISAAVAQQLWPLLEPEEKQAALEGMLRCIGKDSACGIEAVIKVADSLPGATTSAGAPAPAVGSRDRTLPRRLLL